MQLTISNIAWQNENLKKIILLFKKNNIQHLEFAPNILLNNNFSKKNILKIKNFWTKKGFNLYSMQSILYNVKDAYLFGKVSQKKIFIKEIKKKIKLAKYLGVKIIIFGSPQNKKIFIKRKKQKLNAEAVAIFKEIAKFCEKQKVIFCLEANPKIYGCDYLNYTKDAIYIAKKIKNNFFKVNLDIGTVIANKENIKKLIDQNFEYFGHCQLSNPLLKKFNKNINIFKKAIMILKNKKYKGLVSIEMLPVKKNMTNIIKTVKIFNNVLN